MVCFVFAAARVLKGIRDLLREEEEKGGCDKVRREMQREQGKGDKF